MNKDINIELSLKTKESFKVPEGYFDSLPQRVMQCLPEERIPQRHFMIRPLKWAAAAACVLIMWGAYLYVDKSSTVESEVVLADAETYIEDDYTYSFINTGDILTYLDEEY